MHAPPLLNLLLLLIFAPFLVDALRRVRSAPLQGTDLLIWLSFSITAMVASLMIIDLPGLPPLAYSAAAFLALALGYTRALLSMTLVLTIMHPWNEWGTSLLTDALLPVWLMCSIAALTRRFLPPNPFVFLLGCGFFGVFVVCVIQSAAQLGVFWLAHKGTSVAILSSPGEQWLWAALLAGGEATLEGMLLSVLVVYYPRAVYLFDDRFYLQRS